MANRKKGIKRGFALLSPERQKEIASRGGSASGGNFKHDRDRASAAGRKGGLAQALDDKRRGGENSHKGQH